MLVIDVNVTIPHAVRPAERPCLHRLIASVQNAFTIATSRRGTGQRVGSGPVLPVPVSDASNTMSALKVRRKYVVTNLFDDDDGPKLTTVVTGSPYPSGALTESW